MPRSQTPLGSPTLALTRTGLLPSATCTPSALDSVARTYPLPTIIHFSEFTDAVCALASPLLRASPLDDPTSVRLPTGWLAFGRVGLESASHPRGNVDEFQGVSPLFSRPGFISAREVISLGQRPMVQELAAQSSSFRERRKITIPATAQTMLPAHRKLVASRNLAGEFSRITRSAGFQPEG